MDNPSDNPIVRGLQLLTTGWGYNFYNRGNAARADDLLVREKAAHQLGEAAAALSALEVAYRRQFVPNPTRENPYPPADAMERLRAIGGLKARISDVAVRIRGAATPTQDRIWFRLRNEQTLLYQLLTFDQSLIAAAQQVSELARTLTAASWNQDPLSATASFDLPLQQLDSTIHDRTELLLMPTL